MMEDLDKDTVDFQPNYDGSQNEPTVLPSAFPNFLVNGGTGIAVGMATNLAPHNLGEVVDAICAQIDNPEITLPELMHSHQRPGLPGFLRNPRHPRHRGILPHRPRLDAHARQDGDRGKRRRPLVHHHPRSPLWREPRHPPGTHRRTGQRKDPHRHLRHARSIRRGYPHRNRVEARRPPAGGHGPALQTHLDGDLLQREHAGDPQEPPQAALAQGSHRRLHRTPPRGGHPAHPLPVRKGGGTRRAAGSLPARTRPPRRFHQDHPLVEKPRRSPRTPRRLSIPAGHRRGARHPDPLPSLRLR